jgi:hypothetical protein
MYFRNGYRYEHGAAIKQGGNSLSFYWQHRLHCINRECRSDQCQNKIVSQVQKAQCYLMEAGIGGIGPIPWLPRSLDLTPCDFYLLCHCPFEGEFHRSRATSMIHSCGIHVGIIDGRDLSTLTTCRVNSGRKLHLWRIEMSQHKINSKPNEIRSPDGGEYGRQVERMCHTTQC